MLLLLLLLLDELHAPVSRYGGRGRLLHTAVARQTAWTLNVRVVQEAMVVDLLLVVGIVDRSVEYEIIRMRHRISLATSSRHCCSSAQRITTTAAASTAPALVHERAVVVLEVRVCALYGVDVVLVQALVHRVAERDLRGLVAVVVEEDQVHQRNEEGEVEIVRQVDEAVAARAEGPAGQDEHAAHGLGQAAAEEHECVAVEGGLAWDRDDVADARVRQQVHAQVDQRKDDGGGEQEDDAPVPENAPFRERVAGQQQLQGTCNKVG